MRRLAGSVIALTVICGAMSAPDGVDPSAFPSKTSPVDGSWLTRAGAPDATAARDAVARAQAIREETADRAPALGATPWEFVGPSNIGGRVVDLAVHPTIPNLIFVASAGGGVWKSADAGLTFSAAWPTDQTQSMGALAISADGSTLYAGTGEANPGGGSLTFPGTGVYRSLDNGDSWTAAGLADGARIGRLAVDPRNAHHVLAAVAGDLFTPGGDRGIYRTTDGGASWTQTLAGENATTGGIDIAVDPTNPDRVYAALWDHQRVPGERRYQGAGSSVHRSVDGGQTWQKLAGGLPSGEHVGRIGLAVSASPTVVYADIAGPNGSLIAIYASPDGGTNWASRGSKNAGGSTFEWWFGRIWVDPLQPLHLFRASIDLQESFDGGDSWIPHPSVVGNLQGDVTTLHADQHAMVWDPLVPNRVYLGNDGGVYRGHLVQNAVSWIKGGDQPFTQFYSVDVAEDDPSRIVGGAQDNGSNRSFRYTGVTPTWNRYNGGDGEATLISPRDHNLVYACSQYGACARSTTAGEVMNSMNGGQGTSNWFSPLVFDPSDPRVMYWGGQRVVRSQNDGGSWTAFSPLLTTNVGGEYPWGTITTIAVAPSDPGVLLVGTDDGRVWRRGNTGWGQLSGLPALWVSRVAFDPDDADIGFVALSGYRAGDGGAHLYRTDDAGETWRAIGGGLPPAPINDIVTTPQGLLVAADVGVFVSTDTSVADPAWLGVGAGLPLTPISDIRYHAPTDAVYAATFGRGMWRVVLPD